MTIEGWMTLGVIAVVFVLLARELAPPDVVMFGGTVFLGVTGVLTTEQALGGFSNQGVLAIGALFVVAAGIRETGAMDTMAGRMLGKARNERSALIRLVFSVVPLSAVMNNTPLVAMLLPVVSGWCRRNRVSPSRLLIPLSYLAILGGTLTLIGTSTTVVVNGLMADEHAKQAARVAEVAAGDAEAGAALQRFVDAIQPMGMFEITWLGVPFTILGVLYLFTVGRRLLPDRSDLIEGHSDAARAYLTNMQILPGCSLAGSTVERAGLRHLPGLFLVEIGRGEKVIAPVQPDEVLQTDDILTFTGVVATIIDLERIPGLVPVADVEYAERASERREKALCEAVVSETSPLIGQKVRESDFRAVYNAAIVAVHRRGERIQGRVGDIVLKRGDTLLLRAGPHFIRAHQNDPDFYLVSGVDESHALRTDRARVAMTILFVLVLTMTFARGYVSIPLAAGAAAVLMILTQCVSASVARQSVDWRTLITLAGAIGLGRALQETGTAQYIAEGFVAQVQGTHPLLLLAAIYFMTLFLTETVTTTGAAVLMFPIAVATAAEVGLNPRPFVFGMTLAAIASFITPIGYQTHLMVFGPGGYKFMDFVRVGVPFSLIVSVMALGLIPFLWPF